MAARVFALLALPAVALAFCPSMPLRGLPAAARSPAARLVASPPLRMAVQEVSSEAELDSLIASAGTRRGCLSWCFGGCGACAVRICACARMSLCGRKCAVGLKARRHAGAVDAGADLARRRSVAVLREWGEARTHERSRVYDVLCRR